MSAESTPPLARPGLRHVGRHSRHLPVSLERMFENALDWEHLPWLHASSFQSVARSGGGPDWWAARVELAPSGASAEIELRLQRDERRWITRTLSGAGAGAEIWTQAVPDPGPSGLRVEVDFHLPGLAQASDDAAAGLGRLYCDLYARLYDEDEAMMLGRQAALDALASGAASAGDTANACAPALALGPLDALRPRLPLEVAFAGRRYRVVDWDGELRVHAARCPHWLGPLDRPPAADGSVECPWHGYRFDLASGRELGGRKCRLPAAPHIRIDAEGSVNLEANAAEIHRRNE